jgi:predicted nucleic acid-binding protein
MFLLDTNVISELRQGKPMQDAQVLAWANGHIFDRFFLSAITILELEKGVQALEHKQPPQGQALRRWLEGVTDVFDGRTIPFSASMAKRCAALHFPNALSERDAMIAATALEHRFTVVTRNLKDFQSTGVQLLNPWETCK